MKNRDTYLDDIRDIKQIMEQSSKFLSLSGISGVLVGIYALIGAYITYRIIYLPGTIEFRQEYASNVLSQLLIIAIIVMSASILTIVILTSRKVQKTEKRQLGKGTKWMLLHLFIPIIAGGMFILIFLNRGIYEVASPGCLLFYGLALINAAKFTRNEILYMGIFQVLIGLLAAIYPGYGLFLWALGFGVIHILYGLIMHLRYDHK